MDGAIFNTIHYGVKAHVVVSSKKQDVEQPQKEVPKNH
jgi:hypothetical protein